MILVYYDDKHETVLRTLDVGSLTPAEEAAAEGVVNFVNGCLNDRYRCFALANHVDYENDEEIGERYLVFS